MTPDDMEGRLQAHANGALIADIYGGSFADRFDRYQADLRALLLDYQERGRALEEANARIGVMTGRGERCPQCADTKRDCANAIAAMAVDFNRARATLKGKSHDHV
jgi:hypothetical protein